MLCEFELVRACALCVVWKCCLLYVYVLYIALPCLFLWHVCCFSFVFVLHSFITCFCFYWFCLIFVFVLFAFRFWFLISFLMAASSVCDFFCLCFSCPSRYLLNFIVSVRFAFVAVVVVLQTRTQHAWKACFPSDRRFVFVCLAMSVCFCLFMSLFLAALLFLLLNFLVTLLTYFYFLFT